MNYTIEELGTKSKEKVKDLMYWYEMVPYFYSFYLHEVLITCVHAQYTPRMSQYKPDAQSMNTVMYEKHLEGVDEKGYRLRVH